MGKVKKTNKNTKLGKLKDLRLRFSQFGFVIVALQSLPNVAWILWPPIPNRLAGNASSVPFLEYGEHILGVMIVILLLFLVNQTVKKQPWKNPFAIAAFSAIGVYWLCWILYFAGIQTLPVIYAMVIMPPVAFGLSGLALKVWPISLLSAVFLIFHLSVALENFPIF